jgi:tRNA A-37 threonylcarbamoyl transferase component Bud32
MAELGLGSRVDSYTIEAEIGQGGMARVFRARQTSLNRTVALKVLAPELARDALFVQRFRQEAMIAAALEHPNIAPIYDVGQADGESYIAMRFIPGRSLADVLRQEGRLSLERAQRILEQVANALDYAHSRGVVHRDLKPANIILDSNDQAVLVDFGIARAADSAQLTRVGQVPGTPGYMSPEQVRGEAVDYRTDLYSLGILAFELLSGRTPFNPDSEVAVLHQHVYDPPPPLRALRPELPDSTDRAVRRMLAKRPEDRFPSAAAFCAAMKGAAVHSRPRMPLWLPAVAAAGTLAVVVVLMLREPASVPQVEAAVTVVAATPVSIAPTVAPTLKPTDVAGPTPAVVSADAECQQRMAAVDAAWDTNMPLAIQHLQDIVAWNRECGDASNKLYAARVNQAQALLKTDHVGDALNLIKQARVDNPSGGEAAVLERLIGEFDAAQSAAARADWPKVIEQLSPLHDEQPGFDDHKPDDLLFSAYKNSGVAFAAGEQWAKALELYAAALALRPDDPETQQLAQTVNAHLQPAPAPAPSLPDASTQQAVLAAIQRANNAWIAARVSLNPADLTGGVAGQELIDDTGAINDLRRKGQYAQGHEVSFSVVNFSMQDSEHMVVDTRETWYDEIFDLTTRRLISREQPRTYAETYALERRNGGWIVTANQVH